MSSTPDERDAFFESEFAKTLGGMVTELRKRATIAPEFESRLQRGVELRNWLTHRYFWERAGSILTWEGREQMILELREAADYLGVLDAELTAVGEGWFVKAGGSMKTVEAEMAKYRSGQNA